LTANVRQENEMMNDMLQEIFVLAVVIIATCQVIKLFKGE